MARTLNPTIHATRRDEILDVAERLIATRGYERVSIQDVQDELGISRGAIYHYFRSKQDLLGAVVDRTTSNAMAVVAPIADDPGLTATQKLQAVFDTAGRFKAQRSDVLLAVLRSWYSPDNDLLRARLTAAAFDQFTPLMAAIIRQGVTAGDMDASAPDHAATIITALFVGSADALYRLLIGRIDGRITFEEVQSFMHAYNEAIERILGLPPGSFALIDDTSLHVWFA
jgi:AcrR family transcriptional regulator